MKTLKTFVVIAVAALISVAIFYACKKKDYDEPLGRKSVGNGMSIDEINQLSKEIADFHDVCIRALLNNYGTNHTIDMMNQDFYNEILAFCTAQLSAYPSLNLYEPVFMDYDIFMDASNMNLRSALDFILSLEYECPPAPNCINTMGIEQRCNHIVGNTQSLIINANTYEEFLESYNQMVAGVIFPEEDIYNYICVRFFADIFMSSCITWASLGYETMSYDAKSRKTWSWANVKANAARAWNDIKPIASADAEGAVEGAASTMAVSCIVTVASGGTIAPVTGTVVALSAAVGSTISSFKATFR